MWSSTIYNSDNINGILATSGSVNGISKNSKYYTRPFIRGTWPAPKKIRGI